jgi:prepilin-type processing-associated H-X9-DG protein
VLRLAPRTISGSTTTPSDAQSWGWQFQLLPHIEQAPLFRADENTIRAAWIKTYQCPSSPYSAAPIKNKFFDGSPGQAVSVASFGGTSYAGNAGTLAFLADCDGPPAALNGVFLPDGSGRLRLFALTDGASTTILAGEVWEDLDAGGGPTHGRVVGFVGGWPEKPECSGSDGVDLVATDTLRLVGPDFGPSKRAVDDEVPASIRALNFGSLHNNGANFAMCDGSVRFISFGIDRATFSALGTRDGRETIEDDF